MTLRLRARKEQDKAARREAILEVAAELMDRRRFGGITMAEVARLCGLAKGTLYLYFKSKEELFLAALARELETWFDEVSQQLWGLGTPAPAQEVAALIAKTLARQQRLTDLLSILHAVLEQNIERDAAVAFKRTLVQKVEVGGVALEQALPDLPPGGGARLLIRLHALIVGLRQMSDPSPDIASVLDDPEFELLRIDFESEIRDALLALIRGMQAA